MNADTVVDAKRLVWDAWDTLDGPTLLDWSVVSDDVDFHGPAPIGRHVGRRDAFENFYWDLAAASYERRVDLFLGGCWNDQIWVAATGTFVLAETDFPIFGLRLEIPRGAWLRFGEFYRVEGDRIVEVRCLLDIVALAAQAGHNLLPEPGVLQAPPPTPRSGNQLLFHPQPADDTAFTLQLVEDMLGGCNRLVDGELRSMGMDAYWHDDMVWAGPWAIGTTNGFAEFQEHAQGPSVASFPNRRGGFHQARFADGHTAAFTGWPSLQGTFDGVAFRGIEPTGGPIGQNIMDFYVRRDDRLAENWVLIDLIDFAAQCGADLLEGLRDD